MKRILNLVFMLAMAGLMLSSYPAASQTTDPGNNATAREMDNDDGTDWGWMGLLGLIGLYGLRGKKEHYSSTTTRSPIADR